MILIVKLVNYSNNALLKNIVRECEAALVTDTSIEFKYPKNICENTWDSNIEEIHQLNNTMLNHINFQANIYAIYKRLPEGDNWKLVYIGQRMSSGIQGRVKEHLIKKSTQTGAKLENVKKVVSSAGKIGLSFIKIEPESLRTYVEETLISIKKPLWNIHGKKSSKLNGCIQRVDRLKTKIK